MNVSELQEWEDNWRGMTPEMQLVPPEGYHSKLRDHDEETKAEKEMRAKTKYATIVDSSDGEEKQFTRPMWRKKVCAMNG